MINTLKQLESHREQIIARLPSYCQSRINDRFGRYHNECQQGRRLLRNSARHHTAHPGAAAGRLRQHIINCDCLGGAHLRRNADRQPAPIR